MTPRDVRIMAAIEISARRPDGTLDPDLLSVREVQRLARANNNVVCTMVGQWREQQNAVGKEGSKPTPPVIAPPLKPSASASDANRRTISVAKNVPEPPRDAAPLGEMARELAALREQVAQLMTSLAVSGSIPAGHVAKPEAAPNATAAVPVLGTDVAEDAPAPADSEPDISDVERTKAPVETTRKFLVDGNGPAPLAELLENGANEAGAAFRPQFGATGTVASKDSFALPRHASEHLLSQPAHPPALDLVEEAAAEASVILSVRGFLTAIQVFDYLPERLKSLIGRRRAQEVLRLAASRSDQVRQLPDGRWMRVEGIIQIPRQRRKPKAFFEIRRAFADFAAKHMECEGRPFAATELYDSYARLGPPPFVRAYATGVLDTSGDLRLFKLSDGAWWLADRDVPEVHCGVGYHSRKRNEAYPQLGLHVVTTLKDAGHPMSGAALKSTVPTALLKRLPDRNIHHLLFFARRDFPVLYRRKDKTWWLKGLEPQNNQELSGSDRLSNDGDPALPRAVMAKNIRKSSSGDPLPNPDAGRGRL